MSNFIQSNNYGNLPSNTEEFPQEFNKVQIANNQLVNNNYELMAMSTILKSNSQYVICPICNSITPTRTERGLNFGSVIFFCFNPFIWGFFQTLRNKDLTCYNARHYCPRCNANLINYYAC